MAQAHRNLGHRHSDEILRMSDAGLLPRIQLTTRHMEVCHAFVVGNLNFHSTVPKQHHRATRPLERIYLDFFIPGTKAADATAGAVLVIIDDATRFVWLNVAETRVAAIDWFKNYLAKMERQTAQRVVNVITDNTSKFIPASFQIWLVLLGVDHLYSVAHEPNHNGAV
jgi:hypothetical protein